MSDALTCPCCGPGTVVVRVPGQRTATCVRCGIGRHVTAFKAPPAGTTIAERPIPRPTVMPGLEQARTLGKRHFEKRS